MVIAGVITAAAASNRDRLMHQLLEAASLDALTGCLSRGAFEERLDHESMLAERHYATFSLIVADVDNLKALNDANGHHGGDRALKLMAGVLRQTARETDVVGRLGGDEFALLLHEADQEEAMAAAGAAPRRVARGGRPGRGHGQHGGQHVARPQGHGGRHGATGRRGALRGQALGTRLRRRLGTTGHRGAVGVATPAGASAPDGGPAGHSG